MLAGSLPLEELDRQLVQLLRPAGFADLLEHLTEQQVRATYRRRLTRPELTRYFHREGSGALLLVERGERARLFEAVMRNLDRGAGGLDHRLPLREHLERLGRAALLDADVAERLEEVRDRVRVLG